MPKRRTTKRQNAEKCSAEMPKNIESSNPLWVELFLLIIFSLNDNIAVVTKIFLFVNTEGYMTISERIFKILEEREISQASFCKMTGLSGSTVSDWKTKKTNPSADRIMDICNALDLTPEQLLTGKEIDENPDVQINNDHAFSFQDKEIIMEFHELGNEQQKRLLAYLKTLKKLEDLEDIF